MATIQTDTSKHSDVYPPYCSYSYNNVICFLSSGISLIQDVITRQPWLHSQSLFCDNGVPYRGKIDIKAAKAVFVDLRNDIPTGSAHWLQYKNGACWNREDHECTLFWNPTRKVSMLCASCGQQTSFIPHYILKLYLPLHPTPIQTQSKGHWIDHQLMKRENEWIKSHCNPPTLVTSKLHLVIPLEAQHVTHMLENENKCNNRYFMH
jgi:hypothetical protein